MPKNITKLKHRFPLRQIRLIPRFFRVNWPVLALVAITLFLVYLNYEPGTYLVGWDNLQSELNPLLNLKRAFFAVWQEYQSLGLLGGMAHAADLPRVLLVFLLSLLKIDNSLIRYITTFLPLVLGPLGVYFLFYHHLFKEKLDAKTTQFASFLGALFYLLNLSTLQTFFVPFETFTWFYGALPWLLFFTISYISKPSLKRLSTLFIISLIASPSFYVETIFLVFFVSIIPFLIEFYFQKRKTLTSIKIISASLFSLITPQLFWLLPVAFFVLTGGGHVTEAAKANNISSPETYYRNLQFANLPDLALMKGFLFNYLDMSSINKFSYLLNVWRGHLATPLVNLLGYLIFIVILTGLYYSVKKKFAWTASFMIMLFLCLFFLMGGGLLINSAIPLIGELFRSPFTKFSIPLSLAFAFFFSIGSMFILDLFTFLHSRLTYVLTLFSVSVALILFTSPAFSGNLISSNMKLKIPNEYFDLFSYLKNQDTSTRIANVPQYTFWGWNYYDWGYRGSGFLWYGIEQPILDRAFDVWDKNSERYYEEISTAIFSNNQSEFEKIIDKYSVNWILLDKHVISPDGKTGLGNETLENFLNSPKFTLSKSFNDRIFLYQTKLSQPTQNFLSLNSSLRGAKGDVAIQDNSILPFSNLSLRPNRDWTEKAGYLSTSISLSNISVIPGLTRNPSNNSTFSLTLPSLTESEKLIPVKIEYRRMGNNLGLQFTPITPVFFIDSKQIDIDATPSTIDIPIGTKESFVLQVGNQYFPVQIPAEIPSSTDFMSLATTYLPSKENFEINLFDALASDIYSLNNALSKSNPTQCYTIKPNRKIEKIVTNDSVSLYGTDVIGCLSAPLPFIPDGSMISLSFTYSSSSLTPANANISGKDLNPLEIPQALEAKAEPRETQIFVKSSGKVQQVNLILEASDTKSVQEINYSNVKVSTHDKLFSSSLLLFNITEKTIQLSGGEKNFQVSLPITTSSYDISELPSSNRLFPENLNCDQFNTGKTSKTVTPEGFLYQSQNAIECDYLNLRHLPHSLNYLLTFTNYFQSGLPLGICFENHSTFRCDVFDRLDSIGLSQSIIQPIANSNEQAGYTLHLYNQSIGNKITTNNLASIFIRPIPLNFLKSIFIAPSENQAPTTKNFELSSTHPAEFLYTLSLVKGRSGEAERDLNLNLHQTKSPYWKAVEVSQSDMQSHPALLTLKIFMYYPYLNKLSQLDSNDWYNSWSVPSSTTNIAIVYLPQYLEFIGLALIPISLIFIFIINVISSLRAKRGNPGTKHKK